MNILISSILGFLGGFISSYFFWEKQRKLDRPRLMLGQDSNGKFSLKNKGGSFAESVRYEWGYFHLTSQPDEEDKKLFLDEAIAPGESPRIGLILEHRDALVSVYYSDVFGRSYVDVWDVFFDTNDGNFHVFKRDAYTIRFLAQLVSKAFSLRSPRKSK